MFFLKSRKTNVAHARTKNLAYTARKKIRFVTALDIIKRLNI